MADEQEQNIGNYTILGRIAVGGQAEIWRARVRESASASLSAGRVVALKKLRPSLESSESTRRFQSRTAALLEMEHPNIVRYLDSFAWNVGRFDEYHVLVMEFLEGQSLKDLVEASPTGMDWDLVQSVFTQCLRGLVYACSRGIIHRDLTPSNIFVCRDGTVKLIDFEIARQEQGAQTATVGGVRGKFDYMAPDFAPGYRPSPTFSGDRLSDIFSLAVCLYEALTGALPFGPRIHEAGDYFDRWPGGKARRVSFSHGMFWVLVNSQELLGKALALDRAQRYPEFEPFLADFERVHARVIRHGDEEFAPVAVLGHGGFARVFKARRKSDGVVVALKYLSAAENAKRFVREAKVLRRLEHPHVVRFIDFIEIPDPEQYFLVMECLPGMPGASLRDRMRATPQGMPVEEVLELFDRYLDALAYLHGHSVIHRDIKPSNLYAPAGAPDQAKILDLGIARDERGTQTVGRLPGTLEYMAPEFGRADHSRGDALTDLYSLGVCFYEAVAGRLPMPRLPTRTEDALVAFRQRCQSPPPLVFRHRAFRARPALQEFTARLMAFDRGQRYQTAEEARAALRQAATQASAEDENEAVTADLPMFPEHEAHEPEHPPPSEPEAESPHLQPLRHTSRPSERPAPDSGRAAAPAAEPAAPAAGTPVAPPAAAAAPAAPPPPRVHIPLWVWAAGAAAVLAVLALAVLLRNGSGADPKRAGMIVRVNELEDYRLTNYVPALARAMADCEQWGARDPDYPMWPEWRKVLAERAAGYPAYFSNEYVRTAADPVAKQRLVELWGGFQNDAGVLGWSGGVWERLRQFMQTDAAMADFRARLQSRLRDLPAALAATNTVGLEAANDVAGVCLEYRDSAWPKTDAATARMMGEASAKASLLATNYLAGVRARTAGAAPQALKQLDAELERVFALTPRLRDLAGSGFADTRAQVRAVMQARSQDNELTAVQDQVARVKTAADVRPAQQAVERVAGVLPPGDPRVVELQASFRSRLQEIAGRSEGEASSAYEGMNVAAGDAARQALTNFVATLSPAWRAAVTVKWSRLDGLRADAVRRLGALDTETQALHERIAGLAATRVPADPVGSATNLLAMVAAANPTVAKSPTIRAAVEDAWTAVAAGISARIAVVQPLGERAVRLQEIARCLARPELRQAMGAARIKPLDDTLEKELRAFVLTVSNGSPLRLTLESSLFPSLALAPGEAQSTRIDISAAPSTSSVVRVVAPAGHEATPSSFTVRLQRGGGQVVALSQVAALPVDVVFIGDPMVPAVQGGWLNPTTQQWTAAPPTGVRLPPGSHRVRFSRGDYGDIEVPIEIRAGAKTFPVRWPAERDWIPADSLKRLWALEGLWNDSDWRALRAAMREGVPDLKDAVHRERFAQLGKRWGEHEAGVQAALTALETAGASLTNAPARALDTVVAMTATNRALADPLVQEGVTALAGRFCGFVTNGLASLAVDRRKEVLSVRRQALSHAGAARLLDLPRRQRIEAAVQAQWAEFVAWLENASPSPCTVRTEDGRELALGSGESRPLRLPASGADVVLRATAGAGYKPMEWRVKAENGGGARLRVERFDILPVSVTVDDRQLAPPPVQMQVRPASAPDSAYAALPAGGLAPGEYRLRFTRPDYATVETNVALAVGTASWVARYPDEAQWRASPSLDVLRRMRAATLAGDRKAMTELVGAGVKFELAEHEKEHAKLAADFLQGQRQSLRQEIVRVRTLVNDWVAYDYQVADPSTKPFFRYRRDAEARPAKPVLNVSLPTNEFVKVLEPEAGRLRALLTSAGTPDALPGEKDRRASHRVYGIYANEPSGFPQEVVQYMAAYCATGGVPDSYDIQLALYATYRCWQSPLSYARNDDLKRRDSKSWDATLNNHLVKMAQVTKGLDAILKAADTTMQTVLVRRIESMGDRRGGAWIIAYLGRFGTAGWRSAAMGARVRADEIERRTVSQDIDEIATLMQKTKPK